MPLISDSIGRVLGKRYRLVSALGTGASAHVFLAEDVSLQRHVAVKVLQPGLATDESFLKRFRAEARSVASLNHPHVLRVFDWGEDADGPYLVLEYLGGGSLRDVLDHRVHLSHAQAARLGVEAAQGLAYAHARGLVHRDVKPANLLFDEEGRVRIADFGVARALAEASWTEPVGAIVGTARYASPEQAEGRSVDGRADVYSLALVLYEAVTGVVPFVADTTVGTLMARVGQPLPSHRLLGPLDAVLARAAAPDAEARLNATQLAARLEAVATGLAAPDPLPLQRTAGSGPGSPASGSGFAPQRAGRDLTAIGMIDPGSSAPVAEDGSSAPAAEDGPNAPVAEDGPRASAAEDGPTTRVAAGVAGMTAANLPTARAGPGVVFDHEAMIGSPPDASGAPGTPRGSGVAVIPGPPPIVRRKRRHPWRWVIVAAAVAALVAAGLLTAWQEQAFTPSDPVPALAGMTVEQAHHALAAGHFNLRVGPPVYSISLAQGLIVSQQPSPKSSLKQGSTVHVVASKGPPSVQVPSLAGVDCDVATRLLAGFHLKASCPALSAYSSSIPSGQVLNWSYNNQLNPPSAPYGATILVAVSKGPPPVPIPSGLAGGTFAAAQTALQGLGFSVTQAQENSTQYPAGQVTRTSPAAGVPAPVGSPVTVYVSQGPPVVAVPDVTDSSVAQATAALQAAGLGVGQVFGPPGGKVFTTVPAAGQQLPQGQTVNLYTK